MSQTFVHGVKQIGYLITINLASTLVLSRVQIIKQRFVLRAEKTKHSKITLKADANQ
jgi:hypothetical protein